MMVRTGWQLGDAIVLAYRAISLRWGGEELPSLRLPREWVLRGGGEEVDAAGEMRDWAEVNRS